MTKLLNVDDEINSRESQKTLKLERYPLLRKLLKRSDSNEQRMTSQRIPEHRPEMTPRSRSSNKIDSPFSDTVIQADFDDLYTSIATHIQSYYTDEYCRQDNLRVAIMSISAGLPLPANHLFVLISNSHTRLGALFLCISWTILSRCLLLRFGMSNSPGSTFLPPEIVESFQSFSFGRVVTESGFDEHSQIDWVLLSRWKQITAALMHSTYVTNAFSLIDSRVSNVERALMDLDPLLRIFAFPGSTNRVTDLRDVLKKGARFAFTLFGEPCFWQFQWEEENFGIPEASSHRQIYEVESRRTIEIEDKSRSKEGSFASSQPDLSSVFIWPALLRVIGSDGEYIKVGEKELRKKRLIGSFYQQKSRPNQNLRGR